MKKHEVFEAINDFETESRKGWNSDILDKQNVFLSRKSDPDRNYMISKTDQGICLEERLVSTENGLYNWEAISELPTSYLPDAEDYVFVLPNFYSYVGMIDVTGVKEDEEADLNKLAISGIKRAISTREYAGYCQQLGYGLPDNIRSLKNPEMPCSWSGIGDKESSAVEFSVDFETFFVCTPGYMQMLNKHRGHFHEREWAFPYERAHIEKDRALYVRISAPAKYTGAALKEKQVAVLSSLKMILSESGITRCRLIPINSTFI